MKFQNKNEKNQTAFGKWYARAVCDETVDIKGLAAHMASHNTPYSTGAIHGMLKDMVNCTKELLLDGKNVKIDDLAIFSVGLHTTGAPTPMISTPTPTSPAYASGRGLPATLLPRR